MKRFDNKILVCLLWISVAIGFYGCKEDAIESISPSLAEYTQIDFEPSWSHDGTKIVYAHSNIDNDLSGIYIMDSSGRNNLQLVSGFSRSPNLSTDNKWLVFSQFDQIFKIKVNGDSLNQLTFGGKNFYPKWNEDGSLIAYSNTSCNGINCGIFLMKSNGEEKRLIEAFGNYPEWININSLVYFKASRNSDGVFIGDSLFQYSLITKTKSLITVILGDDHKFNSYPNSSVSEFVFASTSKEGFSYIYKFILNGSSILKLTDTQGWSPDLFHNNQQIIYTNRDPGNGRLWIMNINGSKKRQLTN